MNRPRARYSLTLALVALVSAGAAQAHASLVTYEFPASGLDTSLSPTTITPHLIASDITTGSGVTPLTGIGLDYLSLQEATTGTNTETKAVARDSYFQFTVAADPSYAMYLTSLTFDAGKALLMGPAKTAGYAVRSSLDGYTGNLGTGTLTSIVNSLQTVTLGAEFQDLTAPVTFRIYVYADNRLNVPVAVPGGSKYDNITLNGTVVPEPSSLLMGAVGFMGLGILGRRGRFPRAVG